MHRTLAAAALLCASSDAHASVPDAYGLGSRSAAMAGAVCADAHDFSAGYYNAAGLAEAPGIEVSAGYMFHDQRLQVNGLDNGVDDVHGLVTGVVAPGKIFGVPFAFGIGLHLPDSGISFIKARRQSTPRWELYDARQKLLYLEASAAVRPWPFLSVGGGLAYLSATRGRFGIRGTADAVSPFESKLEHEVDADLTSVRFPFVGLRLIWEGWGAVGATYRGQSNLDLELDALLQGNVFHPLAGLVPLVYELEARTIAAFTPQQVAVGISFQRIADLSINFDLTWVNWSAYESPTAQIQASLDLQPPPGIPIDVPESPAPTAIVPPDFRDRFVPRVGVEYRGAAFGDTRVVHDVERRLVEIPLRAGYAYEASPVPDQNGELNLIDADRHTVTVGVGVALVAPADELPGSIAIDGHAQFSILPERTFLKDSPADFVGDYSVSGTMVGGGATLTVAF
jgi:long-chain fatty acid transport protein